MVKIVGRRSLGFRPVYDLGLGRDHNFIVAPGLVAANCFNKSHSTAYAYVTYQTAYLKANYPVEYMAALLTASSDSQDKVEKYRENCQKLGIEVEAPDINRSQRDFTPLGQTILFGLSAVRNLGEGAIDMILAARQEAGGHFKSLADFCSQVDLRVVNRRAIETLILAGAFDHLQANRNQLLQDLELLMAWAQKRTKEKETGQMNLFDLMGTPSLQANQQANEFEQAPSAPPVPDFSLQEKLKLEKEHLGFYVSEHPLKAIQKAAQLLSPISLGEIESYRARQQVSAVALLVAVKKIMTRKGTPMAFVTLEDVSGQAEGVVFPDNYERLLPALVEEQPVMIWGRIDKREERIQLLIEDIEAIEAVRMVMIHLTAQQIFNSTAQQQLKNILRSSGTDNKVKGRVPVLATVTEGLQRHFIRFGDNYWVEDPYRALDSLHEAGFQASAEALARPLA